MTVATTRGAARAWLYDLAIAPMTGRWYRAVLERLPPGCRLLDVGIGTGTALLAHASLLRQRQLAITGVDVEPAYVARCRRAVLERGLAGQVTVQCESVHAHHGGPYDAVYFSGSFMLIPDPEAALRHVSLLLAPAGRLYFTQTFEHVRSPVLETIKPLLRRVTTIDFGRVTYEADFRRTLAAARVEIEAVEPLWTGSRRSALLVQARHVPSARLVATAPASPAR